MVATPGPPYGAFLARCRAGARTRGQTSIQDMYHGLGRGGVAVGRVLRNLRGDDVQVRPGGDFDPIGAPSVAAFAHGAGAQHGPRGSQRAVRSRLARRTTLMGALADEWPVVRRCGASTARKAAGQATQLDNEM